MLFTITIPYLLWAMFLSERLFHRVWSFSLFTLSWLISDIFSLPNYSIPKILLTMFNFLICAALSPLQVVLFRGSVCMKRERITIFSPSDVTSRDTFLAEFVPVNCGLFMGWWLIVLSVSSTFTVLIRIHRQLQNHAHLKRCHGFVICYRKKIWTVASWPLITIRDGWAMPWASR